jgi:hypothetical protein
MGMDEPCILDGVLCVSVQCLSSICSVSTFDGREKESSLSRMRMNHHIGEKPETHGIGRGFFQEKPVESKSRNTVSWYIPERSTGTSTLKRLKQQTDGLASEGHHSFSITKIVSGIVMTQNALSAHMSSSSLQSQQRISSNSKPASSPLASSAPVTPALRPSNTPSAPAPSLPGRSTVPSTPPSQRTRARDLLRKHYGLGMGPPPPSGNSPDPMNMGQ